MTHFELEGVLKVASVHSKAGLVVRKEVLWMHVRWPYNLSLVQDLVDLQYRSLLVWPTRMYWRQQPRLRLSLKLHYDAADICRIRHPQKHSS